MYRKSLLILAIAAACATTTAQAQSTPAKKEAVARILKLQQPGIEKMARALVQDSVLPLMDAAGNALQQRVAADKREALAKEMQADARKYVDDTTIMVRDRALKLAPTTVGPMLEEKFTEDELKQLVTLLESPVLAKFNSVGGDMQRGLLEKVVADTRPQVEPRLRALEDNFAKKLGLPANGGTAGAGKPAAAPKK
ncbi:MAG: hypothetical protein EOO30_06230 [Comamonadaceae bacterium]|nr:MAG: hypothetical protein EOO30_06230 [Comamonadaceae bacterium]